MTATTLEPRSTPTGVPWQWQLRFAGGLLVAFLVVCGVMFWTADSTDDVWKNRIVIFTAVQSLVSAAVGWLFGREVNRAPAEQARADAQQAKEQTATATAAAADARVKAATEQTRGETLAAAVGRVAEAMPVPGGGMSRDSGAGSSTAAPLTALAALARDLYPRR
jgi:hypothetical protein